MLEVKDRVVEMLALLVVAPEVVLLVAPEVVAQVADRARLMITKLE